MIGREQRFHPGYSLLERTYITIMGVPVVGLRIRARNILRLLPHGIDPREILDAGSGPGVISFMLAGRYPRARVTGIDLAEEEIRACQEIATKANISNTHFNLANLTEMHLENMYRAGEILKISVTRYGKSAGRTYWAKDYRSIDEALLYEKND